MSIWKRLFGTSTGTSSGKRCDGCGKKLNPVPISAMGDASKLAGQIRQKALYCASCGKTYCTSCGMKRSGTDFTCPDCGSVIR